VSGKALAINIDHIDTDAIIPSKYLIMPREEWRKHVFEGLVLNKSLKIHKDTIIVTGKNFGCGSSRVEAVYALKDAGVIAVVAKSFARIFFRNAISVNLPVIECDLTEIVMDGDTLLIDLDKGIVLKNGEAVCSFSLPSLIKEIFKIGFLNWIKKLEKIGDEIGKN